MKIKILKFVVKFIFWCILLVICFGTIVGCLFLAHVEFTKLGTPDFLYWIGMACVLFVACYLLIPYELLFPPKMSKEDWDKFYRL